jgi:quercetin dioxygenase-like cupin family protein
MKTSRILALAALVAASAWAPQAALAQEGITRINLQRHDLSVPGREVVQVLVEFAPGVSFPRHAHPGEEIVYVTEGVIEYQLDGKAPVTLKAGEVLFVPSGVIHTARNIGSSKAAELATYIVEKEKPLLAIAK